LEEYNALRILQNDVIAGNKGDRSDSKNTVVVRLLNIWNTTILRKGTWALTIVCTTGAGPTDWWVQLWYAGDTGIWRY
jgi:hypothetical protein